MEIKSGIYDTNNSIMGKISEQSVQLKKGKMERKEKLIEDKKAIIKQQQFLRIPDREEGGLEVMKYYLSDGLTSNSEDEKQLSRARRETAASKKKRETNKQKSKKKVSECLPPIQNSKILSQPRQ